MQLIHHNKITRQDNYKINQQRNFLWEYDIILFVFNLPVTNSEHGAIDLRKISHIISEKTLLILLQVVIIETTKKTPKKFT